MQNNNGNGQDGDRVLLPSGMRAGDMAKGRYFMGTLMPYCGEHGVFHVDTFSIRVIKQSRNGKRYRVLPVRIRFSTNDMSCVVWDYDTDRFTSKPLTDHYMENAPNARIEDVLPADVNRKFDEMNAGFGITITEKEMREFMSRGKSSSAIEEYWNSIGEKSESIGISDMRKRTISVITGVPFAQEERRAPEKAAKTARMMIHLKS